MDVLLIVIERKKVNCVIKNNASISESRFRMAYEKLLILVLIEVLKKLDWKK